MTESSPTPLLRRRQNVKLAVAFFHVGLSALVAIGCSDAGPRNEPALPAVSSPPAESRPSSDSQSANTKQAKVGNDCWRRIAGQIGSAAQYGSGWIQLTTTTNFRQDHRLRLTVGGTAQRIVVRLLAQGEAPDSPSGIVGTFSVPSTRVVTMTLDGNFQNVAQISVHGGPNPWGMFALGGGNGPATLIKAESECP
jgi:hypothetical protein